jgi:UDP-N-acetylglucosamine--N-acetylmuramyl-(pentapeptide) pyrophosphoryl-undecaprenol N-acetylglucosamine transferase
MKICITGAHFTPAQAVIEELKKRDDIDIIYIGRKYTMEGDKTVSAESQILPGLGVKFIPLNAGRLQRKFTSRTIPAFLRIPVGFAHAFIILLREKPDKVLSFGGYVAVPVVISGWLLNIPVIVHEQTLVSGLANTISNHFASKIAVSFETDYIYKKEKIVLTGNPIRKEVLNPGKLSAKVESFFKRAKESVIFITGGNQGARTVNENVLEALPDLVKVAYVIHQTGESKSQDYERLSDKSKELGLEEKYLPLKWVEADDMGGIFERVDLVISRAGANTLTEISYFGVPTLLIPLPFIPRDEQSVNARFFKKVGLAEVLPQSELTASSLVKKVSEMLKSKASLKKRAGNAKSLVIVDAAKRLAQETVLLK